MRSAASRSRPTTTPNSNSSMNTPNHQTARQQLYLQSEAVKRGAAEWVVNPANGETTFKWKEVEP